MSEEQKEAEQVPQDEPEAEAAPATSPVAEKPGSPTEQKPSSPQAQEDVQKPPSLAGEGKTSPTVEQEAKPASPPTSPKDQEEKPGSPVTQEGGRKSKSPEAEPIEQGTKSPTGEEGGRKSASPVGSETGRKSKSPVPDDAGRKSKSPEAEEKEPSVEESKEQSDIQKEQSQDLAEGTDQGTEELKPASREATETATQEETTAEQTTQEETSAEQTTQEETTPDETAQAVEETVEGKTEEESVPMTTEQQDQQDTETSQKSKPTTPKTETEVTLPEPPATTEPTATSEPPTTVPPPPKIPTPDRGQSTEESTVSNLALNMIWSFGLNRNVPVLNLTDNSRKVILYTCAHVAVIYDYQSNRQHILQGHANPITCTCVSEDKRWLATGDKGKDSMVIVWDTYTGTPVQTIFDNDDEGGVVALAMTSDARYLATMSSSKKQILAIWNWTVDGETPICTAELRPEYGQQNFILFHPEDVHYLVTNSESQVIFYNWDQGRMEYYAPPLTDQDFNKQVGRYSQSIFQHHSSRALTATSIGNLVVWDNNKPLTKVVSTELSANKKALKIIRLQDRGINVLTTTEKFIVVGDVAGHVKFFDQSLKLVHWYQDFHIGPIAAISFAYIPDFNQLLTREGTNYPPDATIEAKQFVIRDFVIGSSIAIFGSITADGTQVQVIHREHDAAIHALTAHPSLPYLVIGSYSGLLKIWDYEKKQVLVSRTFERGNLIRCCAYDPKGSYLAVGFVNGVVRVLDAITLDDEVGEPFRYARDAITHIQFSHDSKYLATADGEYTVSVFMRQRGLNVDPYVYLGRYRAHYKPIKDIMFGVHLDSDTPRLLSLGQDRVLVEYDLENSSKDDLRLASNDRIEQSAVPQYMTWYPPVTKEHFIVTANDQFKFKLFNATTKMCRKTLLGPTYGSPVQKISIVPTKEPAHDKRYLAYCTEDKVGLHILPLDGNPHNAMALIAHPAGVANMICSHDGRYLFTAGGSDASVHMWEINVNALEAQSRLGGEGLIPFYGLLDGGREGELFAELEDYFYYAQIRSQGVNALESRQLSSKIALSEVPFVMRAMGFYPSEQEIEDMLNEVKFSRYVETGQNVEDIDLGDFIKLYINHRPAFGLSPERLLAAFDCLGFNTDKGRAIERGQLLDLLQSKGEHMTEYELAEYLTTLLGFNAEGGSSELQDFDTSMAGDLIDQSLPHQITADMFANEVLGFGMYNERATSRQDS